MINRVLSLTVAASVGLLLLALPPVTGFAEDKLDTLFTTPGERQRLDAIRYGRKPPPPVAARRAAPRVRLRFDGLLLRPDGSNTLWLNDGAGIERRQSVSGVVIDPDKLQAQGLQVDVAGKARHIKPGQELDTRSGDVREIRESAATGGDAQNPCRKRRISQTHWEIKC